MKPLGHFMFIWLAAAMPALAGAEIREERVHLKAGTSGTGIQGHIAGRDDVASLGGAEAGQPMTLALHADHQETDFDGLPPGGEGTIVAASISATAARAPCPRAATTAFRST